MPFVHKSWFFEKFVLRRVLDLYFLVE
jgi:hypothetical protein